MKKSIKRIVFTGLALFAAGFVFSCKPETSVTIPVQQETPEKEEPEEKKETEEKKDPEVNKPEETPENKTEPKDPVVLVPETEKISEEEDCEWEKAFSGYTTGMVNSLSHEIKLFELNSAQYNYWNNKTFLMNIKSGDEIQIVVKLMSDSEIPDYRYEPKSKISKDNVDNLSGVFVAVADPEDFTSEWHYNQKSTGGYTRVKAPSEGGDSEEYDNAGYEKQLFYYDYNNSLGTFIGPQAEGDYVMMIPSKNPQLQFYSDEALGWKGYSFADLTCSESFLWKWGDNGGTTGVCFRKGSLVQTITIKPTDAEVEKLNEYGLLMNGYGLTVTQIKLPGKIYNYNTVEAQYLMKREERNDLISEYRKNWKEPFVVITTKDAESVVTRDYYDSIIDVFTVDDEYSLTAKRGQVKVRGNSTAQIENTEASKPIRIKFNKKHNMLGLHGGEKYKSWVMLNTNAGADYMGFNLANEIYKTSPEFESGKLPYYASDCTFVHLFINNKYEGMRLLCEQSQVNKGRVEVTEYDETDEARNNVKTGYMFELDNYSWAGNDHGEGWKDEEGWHFSVFYKDLEDQPVSFTDVNNVTDILKDSLYGDGFKIKNDIYNEDQVKFIKKVMNGIWLISYCAIEKGVYYEFDSDYNLVLSATKQTAKEACEAIIDLESLCNEIILEELVRDNDVGAGSLNMAIDFTKTAGEKYNKLTFECPWDFNWAYYKVGEHAHSDHFWTDHSERLQYFAGAWIPESEPGCKDRSNPWFMLYNKAPWFREMLRTRWNAIGKTNLLNRVTAAYNKTETARKEGKFNMTDAKSFLDDRIPYIEENLWLGNEAYLQD